MHSYSNAYINRAGLTCLGIIVGSAKTSSALGVGLVSLWQGRTALRSKHAVTRQWSCWPGKHAHGMLILPLKHRSCSPRIKSNLDTSMLTRELCSWARFILNWVEVLCSWTRFSLAEMLVLAGTAGASGICRQPVLGSLLGWNVFRNTVHAWMHWHWFEVFNVYHTDSEGKWRNFHHS